MPDQEVHEIQLNGKQLVFMFGAATMVSVVIFLCGVMVGRGVRQPQSEVLAASTDAARDPPFRHHHITVGSSRASCARACTRATDLRRASRGVCGSGRTPEAAPPPTPAVAPAVDDRKAAPKVVPPRETKQPEAPKARAAAKVPAPAPSRFVEPPGKGFVIQVGVFPTEGGG